MSYWHEADSTGRDYGVGKNAEEKFKELIVAKWGKDAIEDTSTEEDLRHCDYWLVGKGGKQGVDVKAYKELKGEPCFIVEIMCNGGAGWLYGKYNTFVAVQKANNDGFLVIRVEKVRNWVKENIKIDITQTKDWYRTYARIKDNRRWDLMVMLPWKVAEELKEFEI